MGRTDVWCYTFIVSYRVADKCIVSSAVKSKTHIFLQTRVIFTRSVVYSFICPHPPLFLFSPEGSSVIAYVTGLAQVRVLHSPSIHVDSFERYSLHFGIILLLLCECNSSSYLRKNCLPRSYSVSSTS